MRDFFIEKLKCLALSNSKIILITGDLGFGVFDEFRKVLPHQFINAGVSEQNMTMLATGMALEGFVVVTYSIGNFPTLRCLEMIRNDAAYHQANVKVVSIGGGFSYGALGSSHHATEDLAIMRTIPGVTVLSPSTPWETEKATESMIRTDGTFYLRLDKSYGMEPKKATTFKIGNLRKLSEGNVAVIATGGIISEVQKAAQKLEHYGVKLKIMSCHSIKPFDVKNLIKSTVNCDAVITVEEHTLLGGLGSVVAEGFIESGFLPKKFLRLGLKSNFTTTVGSQEFLRRENGLDSDSITKKILRIVKQKIK